MEKAVELLRQYDDILILTHQSPDGDTLGSAFALYYCLISIGKNVRVECSDNFPPQYDYMTKNYYAINFTPKFIVSVDVADIKLLGSLSVYATKIDLCIDHHISNSIPAKYAVLNSKACATCEIIYDIIVALIENVTPIIADCLFTGITTDSGCFKYSNVTANTHRIAANLIEMGANHSYINRLLFDTKSKSRILIEQKLLESIEFYYDDRVAIAVITNSMLHYANALESELDGLSSIPRMIEGVEIGITFREKTPNMYKLSVRTTDKIDAAAFCAVFDGGGHKRAAGCTIEGNLQAIKIQVVQELYRFISK